MNMKYAMRSEDTEQINVVSWANWNMNRYPELKIGRASCRERV